MSTFLWQEIVFGPIHSRRLGSSLGINLLPVSGKACNFDCIYCECGWNKDGRTTESLPTFQDISREMRSKFKQLHFEGTLIDTITFSGNGEPTVHPDFPAIIDLTLELRNQYFPNAVVSVLSNATTAHKKEIRDALDNPIMKLDGGSDRLIGLVNRPPAGYSSEKVLNALKAFKGKFILQTMFLKGEADGTVIDSTESGNVENWMESVRELKPREIMIYTIDRETPAKSLQKVPVMEMETIAEKLRNEGFYVQVCG